LHAKNTALRAIAWFLDESHYGTSDRELGERLARTTTPLGLRRIILEASRRFDWPEWDRYLIPVLQHEEHLPLFDIGSSALGELCTRGALDGLRRLKGLRQDAERQAILDRELKSYEPDLPFEACLDALMVGMRDPKLACLGARWLVALSGPEHLDALVGAFRSGDGLTSHLALRLLAFLQGSVAERFLLLLPQDTLAEFNDVQALEDAATLLEAKRGKARLELLLAQCGACFKACTGDLLQGLRGSLIELNHPTPPDLEPLRVEVWGPSRGFLLKALELLTQGKPLGFESLLRESLASLPSLRADYAARLDDVASLLAAKVDLKHLTPAQVLPALEEPFHASAGGDGLLVAYLRLIPYGDQDRLERLLTEPTVPKRIRCLEILGACEEDGLAPFFLKAMGDPVKEVGQIAIHQLGKLPSGLPGMLELFRSGDINGVREAIRFFKENNAKEAVKALTTFIASESPDDLLVDAVNALGNIRDPSCLKALLRQLHSGKPLMLQVAIVDALSQLGTAEASLGLLKKSEELTLPEVLLLALKGSLSAFQGFEQPFPPDQLGALERLVERCCDPREGAGLWLHAALVMQDLYIFDHGAYDRLINRFSAFLVGMHQQPSWVRTSHDQVSEVIKKLSRRATSVSTVEEREQALLASIESIPEAGQSRMQVLFRLKELLADPEHALSEASSKVLVAFLGRELLRENLDYNEIEFLCKIAGLSGQSGMIEPLEDLLAHAKSIEVKRAARKALLALGLTDREIDCRKPIKSILLLEPNAFFRNRLVPALESAGQTMDVAATRQEAQAILSEKRVDLLISESHDVAGALWMWLEAQWRQRKFRYLLLSTANHDLGSLGEKPWVIGRLYKPYPLDDLIKAIEE
jgi:hypothetical protein